VFIELTDHLRCPEDHAESFLVLIPDEMAGRVVQRGVLGCPVCRKEYPIRDGVVYFGEPPATVEPGGPETAVDAVAIAAFLGIEGPGGYVALVGDAAGYAPGLSGLWPGVHLVLVNPPRDTPGGESWSILHASRLPIQSRALRGIVLGAPFGRQEPWPAQAIAAVLPGLRAAGQGAAPRSPGFELLGEAEGWWVGRTGR
jgi:uncharacterized protein YbaR (Trm112 family)